jgi:hypothetical protein
MNAKNQGLDYHLQTFKHNNSEKDLILEKKKSAKDVDITDKSQVYRYRRQLAAIIKRGYDPTILRHTTCLVFNPFTVGSYAFLF